MRRYKKTLLLLFAVTIPLFTAMTIMRGQSQEGAKKSDEPTRIQAGIMTEKEKRHGKLHERHGTRSVRNTKKSINLVISVPFMEAESGPPASSTDELLEQITCGADAAVVGKVTGKKSQLTEDGTAVFTDYEVQVDEVVDNNAPKVVQQGESITVTRPGGAVELDGNVIRMVDRSFTPFDVGDRYLLFLRRVAATGAYQAVGRENGFKLDGSRVLRLTEKELPYPFGYENGADLLLQRTLVIGRACAARPEGGAK